MAMFWSSVISYWLLVISLTLLVGVLWEIWEYLFGILMKKRGREDLMPEREDTIEDLIMDVTGAAIWALILML